MRSIEWDAGEIVVIDQTALPHRQEFARLRSTADVAEAITSMRVRGAPALGIVGAMGVAQAAMRSSAERVEGVLADAEEAGRILAATRSTAVNLAWGIERVLAAGRASRVRAPEAFADVMLREALAVQAEDEEACSAMAKHAVEFFRPKRAVLTHCNTGFLCTGGWGTALGAIRYAHEAGLGISVIATETRPLLQGARLTAWELRRFGVPHALVVDAAAAGLIARGQVGLVIVGADRIAANGDVANKVGTYPLALAAAAAAVPFVVVAPTSTIDASTPDGSGIPIEERVATEVTLVLGSLDIAPSGTESINPAFDITPSALVTAIVTEHGVARPPFKRSLARLLGARPIGEPKPKRRAPAKPTSGSTRKRR